MYRRIVLTRIVVFSIFFLGTTGCQNTLKQDNPKKIPVIYSTDLYHLHADPDDHFDLASMYAITELDIESSGFRFFAPLVVGL